MVKYYKVKFGNNEYLLPKAGIGNNKYVAVFDPYSNASMSRDAAHALYNKIESAGLGKIDVVISAEVKGAAIAQRISDYLDTNLLVFRKKIKINFEDPIIAHVKTFTSGTNQLFIDKNNLEMYRGKSAILVDDVISTGSTINAIKDVLKKFNINILKCCCIFKESNDVQDDILYVDTLPIFTE